MNYAEKWDRHVRALVLFVEEHGHAEVPSAFSVQTADGTVFLGPWVSKVRGQYRNGKLLPHRAAELSKIPGWHWNVSKPGPRVHRGRDEEIIQRVADGTPVRDIAKELNITTQRVNQILRRHK